MSVLRKSPVPNDVDIAQSADIKPISEVAARYGLHEKYLEHYGVDKAKVRLEFLSDTETQTKRAKYIDVTAITPTPLGEGKTTTTIGLTQGLGYIGKKRSRRSASPPWARRLELKVEPQEEDTARLFP